MHQVVHHIADSHVNCFVRIRKALTEDNPPITAYKEALWAELPDVKVLPVNISITLLHALHRRIVAMLDGISPEDFERSVFHPEHQRLMPIWEIVALYAWHSRHHTAHIMKLRERMGW